jgi:hypothetical protein
MRDTSICELAGLNPVQRKPSRRPVTRPEALARTQETAPAGYPKAFAAGSAVGTASSLTRRIAPLLVTTQRPAWQHLFRHYLFGGSVMRRAARAGSSVVFAAMVLAGCSSATSGGHAGSDGGGSPAAGPSGTSGAYRDSGRAIAVGAGPKTTYTVQQQPPAGSCHYRYEDSEPLEDRTCTPGAISPAVTQANLTSTICRKGGYTSGIRPPTSVTGKEKKLNAISYGYTGRMGDAEYDHLISLQLGGDPNDARNLWVEPPDPGHRAGSGVNNRKDPVETKLHTAVCAGKVTLAAAQQAIVSDWTTALSKFGLS